MATTDVFVHTPEEPPCACAVGRCVDDGCFVTVADTKDNGAVVVVGGSLYWRSASAILRLPVDGGGAPSTVVRTAAGAPAAFVVDGTNVYWTNPALEAVFKTPLAGGADVRLASQSGLPTAIAVDARTVYFGTKNAGDSNGALVAVPIVGGPPKTIFTSPMEIRDLQSDGSALFLVRFSEIERISASGAAHAISRSLSSVHHLATSDGQAFWSGGGGIAVVHVASGTVRNLAFGEAWQLAVSSSHVYWYELADGGSIRRVPVAGGDASVVARRVGMLTAMAADATGVYWTTTSGVFKLIPKP